MESSDKQPPRPSGNYEPKRGGVDPLIRAELFAAMDLAVPDCFWKKRFLLWWGRTSLTEALAEWKTAPIVNPDRVMAVEAIIRRILTDDSTRTRR